MYLIKYIEFLVHTSHSGRRRKESSPFNHAETVLGYDVRGFDMIIFDHNVSYSWLVCRSLMCFENLWIAMMGIFIDRLSMTSEL